MVVHTGLADHQTRLPMSWEEYNQLEDDIRGEFIDGALLTPPTPDRHHQVAVLSLVSRLFDVCAPSESVTTGWGWSPTGAFEEYIPDVMVHTATDDQARFTGVPLLCVEVTSGNWTNDLILKRAKYAAARLQDYWVVDRRERVLRQYVLQGDLLVEAGHLGGHGMAEARFAGRSVSVDLDVLSPTP